MPHFEVQITRSVLHMTTITVEADNEDLAERDALAQVEDPDNADKAIEWEFEDESFEVENTDEVDPPEDEEDEDETEEEDDNEDDDPEAAKAAL